MVFFYLTLVLILGWGAGSQGLLSPQDEFELSLFGDEPPSCKKLSDQEAYALDKEAKGKIATFSQSGKGYCEREIFEYGERNSFFEFVVKNIRDQTPKVMAQLKQRYGARDLPWIVRVRESDLELREFAQSYFEHDLAESFATGKLMKIRDLKSLSERGALIFQVDILRVDDPQNLFRYAVKYSSPQNSLQEVTLWKS